MSLSNLLQKKVAPQTMNKNKEILFYAVEDFIRSLAFYVSSKLDSSILNRDDCLQIAYEESWKMLSKYNEENASLETFLSPYIAGSILTEYRKLKNKHGNNEELTDEALLVDIRLEKDILVEEIETAIKYCDGPSYIGVLRSHLLGYSFREISVIFGISVSRVKQLVDIRKQNLQNLLRNFYEYSKVN